LSFDGEEEGGVAEIVGIIRRFGEIELAMGYWYWGL
jgi:hypothetical protein